MTANPTRLTDEVLRRALIELTGEPDAEVLLTEVVRIVDDTPQVRRLPWAAPAWGRGALLVAALIVMLAAGVAVALSQPRPAPQPDPSVIAVTDFVLPFTYRVPAEEAERMHGIGAGTGPFPMYGITSGSNRLTVFEVTGNVHECGARDTDPSASSVTVSSVELSRDPTTFMDELRDEVGVGLGAAREAMLGNLPAVEAEIGPAAGRCSDALIHQNGLGLGWAGLEPALRGPATLIVASANGTSIGVMISASNEDAYSHWLPVARAYVDSFVFEGGAER